MTGRRLQLLVLSVAAALAAALLGGGAATADRSGRADLAGGAGTAPDGVALRAMSFNIHAGIGGDDELDLARTAEVITGSGADVVGLQEVDVHWGQRSDFRDQARELAELTGMRVFFAPIYDLPPHTDGQPRRQFGVAVLSAHPIVRATNHWITRLSTQDPEPVPKLMPGFAEVVTLVRGRPVHVYSTHLDYRADPTVRQMQVDDMLGILGRDPRGHAQVLIGDFNAEPDAPELAPLWAALADSWTAGDGAGHTYPADAPSARIDYVTVSRSVSVSGATVLTTPASDHLPVLADLTVRHGRP